MTYFEVKNYSTSSPGELLADINASEEITKECTEIVARGKKTFFVFNDKLTEQEKSAFNTLVNGWAPPSVNTTELPGINSEISEPMTFSYDSYRGKHLSTETTSVIYSENRLTNMNWINIGTAANANIGLIMPFNGTIIRATGMCRETHNQTMNIHLYINTDGIGNIITFFGSGEQISSNLTMNVDFAAGDKIRLRGVGGSKVEDVAITLWIKWRQE